MTKAGRVSPWKTGDHRSPAIAIATLMREEGPSGVQSHVRAVAEYLRSVGQHVSVVTPFSSTSPMLRPLFGLRYAVAPFSRTAGVWWYNRWHQHFLAEALDACLSRRSTESVVYAQCPFSAEAALAAARGGHRVVMVVHFHVSQADEWAAKGQIPVGGRLYESIQRREQLVLPRLDGVVYVSKFMKASLESRIPSLRLVPSAVIPNFVTPGGAMPSVPSRDLVTIGALEPHKNHQYLLDVIFEARRRGHRYSLSIIGEGPQRSSLERTIRRMRLADQVALLGYRRDVRSLIRQHRLYVHASTMESFGMVLIEAMAEGIPVVAGPVGGIPEIVRDGTDGVFWSLEDPWGAADVLIRLMEEPERLAAMGAAARTRVAREYSVEVVGLRLHEFLLAKEGTGRG